MSARSFASHVAVPSFLIASMLAGPGGVLIGCGHGEDEWQAELKKEKNLQADLDAEKAAHKSTKEDLDKAKKQVAQLKTDIAHFQDLEEQLGTEKDHRAKLEKALADAEARTKVLEAAKARLEALKKKLDELKSFGLKVAVRHNQIVIDLPGDVLFEPGSELLSKGGREVLAHVADVIKSDADLMKRFYQVIGHTDNAPYGGKFKDNVGLSVMRAREVYEFLTATPDAAKKRDGGSLPVDHWSAAGYGDLDPVAGTREAQSGEEKKKNRRVEIAILPDASELMKLDVGE
ncbi:MAG: OmpA family protein [Polyangiales bacterium]